MRMAQRFRAADALVVRVRVSFSKDMGDVLRPPVDQPANYPDEIAGLVAYLAGKESAYMTGSSLTIDGGMAL
jgi:3-oxoacyl-[acyl-carrier protein] reductase